MIQRTFGKQTYEVIVDTPIREIVCVQSPPALSIGHRVSVKNVVSDSRIGEGVYNQPGIESSRPSPNYTDSDSAVLRTSGDGLATLRKAILPRPIRPTEFIVMPLDDHFRILISNTRHCGRCELFSKISGSGSQ